MNKDNCKYISNCTLYKGGKANMQLDPLQMMDIPHQSFNKIAIDLITDLNVSMSGSQHVLTLIDHLTGWPEVFAISDKNADTIVCVFITKYLPVHMCPWYILSNNKTEFKNHLVDDVLQHLGFGCIFSAPYHPHSNGKPFFLIYGRYPICPYMN